MNRSHEDHCTEKIRNVLIAVATVLVLFHILNISVGKPFWTITRLIDVDLEANIPTWFSNMVWILGACSAYQCGHILRKHDRGESLFWKITAAALLFLSMDEVAQIHETLGKIISFKILHLQCWRWTLFLLSVLLYLGPSKFYSLSFTSFIEQSFLIHQKKK